MLLTSSYSKTLIRENLSRYRMLPILGFVLFFNTGMLPVLMSYNRFRSVASQAESIMSGTGFVNILAIMMLAVIASAWVFGYLHDQVSTNAVHSMPLTRRSLFVSAVISGLVMIIIPIVIFALMTLVLRGATSPGNVALDAYEAMGDTRLTAKEIYTLPHVLALILKSTVITVFYFAISCLSAVLSGRKTIHPLLSIFLFVLPFTLAMLGEGLCNTYLFGFSGLDINYRLLGPYNLSASEDSFSINWGYIAYYIVLALLIFALAAWIYSRVRLERVGNATTFPIVGDVLAVILTLICTLGFSDALASLTAGSEAEKPARFIIAALISSAIFYAVMRMIADSSPSIFNAGNLKKYGICLAILAVILVFTALDITGYSKRLPDISEVSSVHIDSTFPNNVVEVDKDFTDPESIEAAFELQQAIISDRGVKGENDYGSDSIRLTWKLRDGREIYRAYEAKKGKAYKATSAALKKLFESPEYKAELQLDADDLSRRCSSIEVYGNGNIHTAGDDYTSIRKEDYKDLLEAANRDLAEMDYDRLEEMYGYPEEDDEPQNSIYLEMSYRENEEDGSSGKTLTMGEKDVNTMEFLKDKGYIKIAG